MADAVNQRFWNRWAARYDRFMRTNQSTYAQIVLQMKNRLCRDMDILELACGTGLVSRQIVGSVHSLEATDFSPEMIAEAKKQPVSARLHYSVQDATRLPYADRSFDAVVIVNALHVMPEPERALVEARRVLKGGGLLIAPTFLHGEGSGFRLRARLLELAGFRAYHKWDAGELTAFISRCGFVVDCQQALGSGLAPLCYLEAHRS